MKGSIYERWAAKVAVAPECLPSMDTPCWEWTGSVSSRGYGHFAVTSRAVYGAHRVSYELNVGAVPAGMHVCHRCDNRKCVAPHHLFVGTASDNMRDMVRKGRNMHVTRPDRIGRGDGHWSASRPERVARGERHSSRTRPESVSRRAKHGSAKLTETAVRDIRERLARGERHAAIAAAHGVSRASIGNISTGATWREPAPEVST